MPPATPSPHRFLPGRRNASLTKHARHGQSSLRKQVAVDRGDGFADATPQAQQTPKPVKSIRRPPPLEGDGFQATPLVRGRVDARQFAQTPRFSYGKASATTHGERSPSPQKTSHLQALRASTRPTEDVEEAPSSDHQDEVMLDIEQHEAVPTTETSAHTDTSWISNLPHSPKRRKLKDSQAFPSPSRPVFKHVPPRDSTLPPHQFLRAPSVATEDLNPPSRRPAFLPSALASSGTQEPLPETLSPQRRGEKFVPGGMAATLQQWVVEKGHEAVASRRGQGYLRGEEYVMQVVVENFTGNGEAHGGKGTVLICARKQDGQGVRMVLVGDGKNTKAEIRAGTKVGIRAPAWEVDALGQIWTVSVDWRIISSTESTHLTS